MRGNTSCSLVQVLTSYICSLGDVRHDMLRYPLTFESEIGKLTSELKHKDQCDFFVLGSARKGMKENNS